MFNANKCACTRKIRKEFTGKVLDLETQKRMSADLSNDEYSLKFELFQRFCNDSLFSACTGNECIMFRVDNDSSKILEIIM